MRDEAISRVRAPYLRWLLLVLLCAVPPVFADELNTAPVMQPREQMAPTASDPQWPSEHSDEGLNWRVWTSALYLVALGGIAIGIARWRKTPLWTALQSTAVGTGIKVQQRLKVSPQLTLLVTEVEGTRYLIAASPQAISVTPLETHRDA
jgi:hypothetical protein